MSVFFGDSLQSQTREALESAPSQQCSVYEWFLRNIDSVVLGWTEPLRQDVGVGEGAVRDRGEEEHGDRGETIHIHLITQTLKQVVDNTTE